MPGLIERFKCRTCSRYLSLRELFYGLCDFCRWMRIEHREYAQFDGLNAVRCSDCNCEILFEAYQHWDRSSNCWLFTCLSCNRKRVERDDQYRNTPYAFRNKIQ